MAGVPPSRYGGTRRAALGGVLAAGSLVFLSLACIVPSGRLGLAAAAGLFPVAAVLALGRGAGYLCWASASALGMILLPDKGVAALFLAFFGVYPVLKSRFENLRSQAISWLCKLTCFNAALTVFWFFLRGLFLPEVPEWLSRDVLVFLLGNIVFLIYDIGLSRLIFALLSRIKPKG